MKQVAVDLEELAFAFDDGSPEHEYFLDLATGEVLLVSDNLGYIEARQERERIEEESDRFLSIPQFGSSAESADMESFVETVEDERLLALLEGALDGNGAFRRFRDVLNRYPVERDRWYAFKDERLKTRIREWLTAEQIVPVGKA